MENGKRKIKNSKTENGGWRMENRDWRMENGRIKWEIENGKLLFFFLDFMFITPISLRT